MKVVILCGGLGTRLREETEFRPKPMVPVGDRPLLWHIMKVYASHGFKEFILCLGYKGEIIKEYFRNYHWNTSDVTLQLGRHPQITYHTSHDEADWTVTLLDTGQPTMTGGRIQRALPYIEDENFLLTYGDGLTDSNITASIQFHETHGGVVTLTAVPAISRFGVLEVNAGSVTAFQEKPAHDGGYINGGFFVVNRRVADYLTGDDCVFEREPLSRMAQEGLLKAYCHDGFWQCMDTFREQQILQQMWTSGQAPWRVW